MIQYFADIVITTQFLIQEGWKFEYDDDFLIAKKGEVVERSDDVMGLIERLKVKERATKEDKLLNWLKGDQLCPNCKIKPPLNLYSCDNCGWDVYK